VLAAHRTGFRHVILPRDNEPDLAKLPEEVRNDMTFTLAEHLDQVLAAAFAA
jgi:ATP-dependent Lon protease